MNIGALDIVAGSVTGLNTTASDVFTGVAVAGTTTVWSNPFKLMAGTSFGCMVLCQGSGPLIQIQLEESFYDLKLNGQSLTGSSSLYVVPDAFPDIFSQISDNNWHLPAEPVTPIPMYHGRFKIIGLPGNGAGVTVFIALFRQEPGRFL
jgi:hypothetical protein